MSQNVIDLTTDDQLEDILSKESFHELTENDLSILTDEINEGNVTIVSVCERLHVPRTTFTRNMNKKGYYFNVKKGRPEKPIAKEVEETYTKEYEATGFGLGKVHELVLKG